MSQPSGLFVTCNTNHTFLTKITLVFLVRFSDEGFCGPSKIITTTTKCKLNRKQGSFILTACHVMSGTDLTISLLICQSVEFWSCFDLSFIEKSGGTTAFDFQPRIFELACCSLLKSCIFCI